MRILAGLDLTNTPIINMLLEVLAAAPSSPQPWRIYTDSTLGCVRVYNGTAWIDSKSDATLLDGHNGSYYLDFANSTGQRAHTAISDFDAQVHTARLDQLAIPTADVSINAHRLTSVADPTADQDAATKAFVAAQLTAFLSGSGFTTALAAAIHADDYAATIGAGDGTTKVFTLTHGLATQDVIVQVRDVAAPFAFIGVDVAAPTTATVTVTFTNAPAINSYRVLITRVGA